MTHQQIADYLRNVKETRSVNTFKAYENALKAYFSTYKLTVSEAGYVHFLKSIHHLSSATQQQYRSAVAGLFIFMDVNINFKKLNRLYAPRGGKRLPVVDMDAIRNVIAFCEKLRGDLLALRDRAFILTLADTGLRLHEACKLRRGDIDRKERRIVIIGKGKKQAVVRISKRAIRAIDDYLAARAELDGSTGKPLASLPLFARHDKGAGKKLKPVGTKGMWAAVKERIKQAGEKQELIRIHDFRHYFVTTMYLATRDPKKTKEFARHENSETTDRYTHLYDDELDELYDEVMNG